MDTNNNNNNKQCECNKLKVVNDLLKRISNLEFEVEDKDRENEKLNNIINELENINEKLSLALNSAESKLQQKENIIKEIREYVKQLIDLKEEDYLKSVNLIYIEKILEILDKANESNEE